MGLAGQVVRITLHYLNVGSGAMLRISNYGGVIDVGVSVYARSDPLHS